MAYLGNTPTTQSFISGTDYFNGTGAQTAFTLSRAVGSINDIQVTVNNVVQQPNDAYTLSGTTLTMTSAPSAGTNNVYVRYLSTTTQSITPSQNTVSYSTLDSNVQGDLGISFKNRIINSNMAIDQRNAGASVVAGAGNYTLDRWNVYNQTDGAWTVQQVSTAPVGFVNSAKITVTTADTSLSSAQYSYFRQAIEGYNIADLGWGTANAKTVTLSFWVQSSLTGTFSGAISNNAYTTGYPFTYTINAANTWEYKTVTITGATSGSWPTDNSASLQLLFSIGTGTTQSGTAGVWGTTQGYIGATGASQIIGTLGATWYVTGVQLEVGTQATTFTTAGGSYGAELALCQRYCNVIRPNQTANGLFSGMWFTSTGTLHTYSFPVQMRSAPTLTTSAVGDFQTVSSAGVDAASVVALSGAGVAGCRMDITSSVARTAGQGCIVQTANTSSTLIYSAEL